MMIDVWAKIGTSVICAVASAGTLAACTPSRSAGDEPLARFTSTQMCQQLVATGQHLVSVRQTTAARALAYLGLGTGAHRVGWGSPPANSRAAICLVRDRTGSTLYAINIRGGYAAQRQGIVLLQH